ncbi:MAG: SAM-dependent methyltransferase [Bacteroidia bacterium]|nr:MAG: SAM-dependent methyltransferase [Bacteroidia bacterium]
MTKPVKSSGTLFLIPSSLGSEYTDVVFPAAFSGFINTLEVFIVENARTARRFLKSAGYSKSFDDATFHIMDKHTSDTEQAAFLDEILTGRSAGLLSEAGCPGIADPGQQIVRYAHSLGIPVKPLVGPNSILLALMASGMNGQQFCFHGYLPIRKHQQVQKIKEIEKDAKGGGATQIFMETPFRNLSLAEEVIRQCSSSTLFCIATDLTMETEEIITKPVGQWRKDGLPKLHKRPCIFLLWYPGKKG